MTEQQRELIMNTPRLYFDTRIGIEMKLKEQYGLQEVSNLRRLFHELHPEDKLIEYVVDGQFLLPRDGSVHKILDVIPNISKCPKVIIVDDFLKITGIGRYTTKTIM